MCVLCCSWRFPHPKNNANIYITKKPPEKINSCQSWNLESTTLKQNEWKYTSVKTLSAKVVIKGGFPKPKPNPKNTKKKKQSLCLAVSVLQKKKWFKPTASQLLTLIEASLAGRAWISPQFHHHHYRYPYRFRLQDQRYSQTLAIEEAPAECHKDATAATGPIKVSTPYV